MAKEWFYAVGQDKQGPITSEELKSLVASGTIRPGTFLWHSGMKEWQRASKIRGLFPAGDGATSIPTENSGFLDRAKASAKNLAVLATKQASIQKLSFVDLPAADHATGSKALTHNLGKEQFASTYNEIAQIDVQVAELRKTEETASTDTITDRMMRAGRTTAKFARVEKLLSKRKRLVTTLGSQLRISTTCNSDGVLDQELARARIAEQSIEKLNEEVQALGKKKSLFGTTRTVAAIVVIGVMLVIGGWMKGKLFRSDAGNAKITTVGTPISESLTKIDADREKISERREEVAQVPDTKQVLSDLPTEDEVQSPPTPNGEDFAAAVGRKLQVQIATGSTEDGGQGWGSRAEEINPSLQAIECYATTGELIINFDVDTAKWTLPLARVTYSLRVRLFDESGNYLTHFITAEKFTGNRRVADEFNTLYQRYAAAGRLVPEYQVTLLQSHANSLTYSVNVRDLRDAMIIEIGFFLPE